MKTNSRVSTHTGRAEEALARLLDEAVGGAPPPLPPGLAERIIARAADLPQRRRRFLDGWFDGWLGWPTGVAVAASLLAGLLVGGALDGRDPAAGPETLVSVWIEEDLP